MTKKNPRMAILDHLDFSGKRVADIGCGDGSLGRVMAGRGATVTGIDVKQSAIEKAQAADQVEGASFALGSATEMPFEDGSKDLVVFVNSLHHMAPEDQRRAIAEAGRVLVANGELFFSEPMPEGSRYELNKPVADERDLRRRAQEAIADAVNNGFTQVKEDHFMLDRAFADFDDFRDSVTHTEERLRNFEAHEAEVLELFERLGEKRTDGVYFEQPMRINMLRKTD